MCIICNLHQATAKHPDEDANVQKAEDYLLQFAIAKSAMNLATKAMLDCAQVEPRYDKTHKAMVRIMRTWNSIEQQREAD